jgi:hypothetical protein
MRRTLIVGLIACFAASCSKSPKGDDESLAKAKQELREAIEQSHGYDYQDGMQYGYTAARTEHDATTGNAAPAVTMLMYAGERDGHYQLHQRNGTVLTAMECTYPCEVMKVMTVIDSPGLKMPVNVQRFRLNENAIAMLALKDASRGYLKQYGMEYSGKSYTIWLDESKGIVKSLAPKQ